MKYRSILLLSAVSLMAAPALAAPQMKGNGMGMKHGMMWEADANKDGVIDRSEFDAETAAKFKDADTNKDGVVSKQEMIAHWERERERRRQMMMDQMFQRMDQNGDGKISSEEHNAVANGMFERMDHNNDGKLSPDDRQGMGPGMMKGQGMMGGGGMMAPVTPDDE